MTLLNSWVGYLNRSYQSVRSSILGRLSIEAPEITDYSKSNPLIIFIDIVSGLIEQLNYYIDVIARESYLTTAKKYSSIIKITRLLDYSVKASNGAYVDLLVRLLDANGASINSTRDILLPFGTRVETVDGVQFITTEETKLLQNTSSVTVKAKQKVWVSNTELGLTNGIANQQIPIVTDYQHGSMSLTIAGEPWILVETLALSLPTDRHFIISISEQRIPYIQFGNGLYGAIPSPNYTIYGNYYTTSGSAGMVGAGLIIQWVDNINIENTGGSSITVNNLNKATGGTDIEGLEEVRVNAPLSIRTLYRAVTRQDFIDLALLYPGVVGANLDYEYGDTAIEIFIAPTGGGYAPQSLLSGVKSYIDNRKMVGLPTILRPSGEGYIVLSMAIFGKFRAEGANIRSTVTSDLLIAYGYNNTNVNKPVRISDVMAIVDNNILVDYCDITILTIKPFIRPRTSSVPLLQGQVDILSTSVAKISWTLSWYNVGTRTMRLLKNNVLDTEIVISETVDTVFNDTLNLITITVGPTSVNTPNVSYIWDFVSYPYNRNIELSDFSMPLLLEENLTLTITENLINP